MAEEKKKDGSALLAKKKKVKPRKSRDADCCSVNFLKCVLHIFNVVFLFAGAGVLGVGAWTVAYRHRYVALLPTPTYPAIAYLLIIAGAIGVPLSALGCCGLKTENRTSLLCYTYFLLISFILEAGAGGLAYYYEVAVEDELHAELNDTFLTNYALDNAVTNARPAASSTRKVFDKGSAGEARGRVRGAGAAAGPRGGAAAAAAGAGAGVTSRHKRSVRRAPCPLHPRDTPPATISTSVPIVKLLICGASWTLHSINSGLKENISSVHVKV